MKRLSRFIETTMRCTRSGCGGGGRRGALENIKYKTRLFHMWEGELDFNLSRDDAKVSFAPNWPRALRRRSNIYICKVLNSCSLLMPRRSADPDEKDAAKPEKGMTAPRRDFWEHRFDAMEEQKTTLAARKTGAAKQGPLGAHADLVASSFAALLAGPSFAEGFSRDDFLADVKQMRKRLRARRRGLLNPKSPMMQIWDIIVMIALLITSVIAPFEVALLPTAMNAQFIFSQLINAIFMTDLVSIFFLPLKLRGGGMIYSHKRIAIAYLRSWFVIDFVSYVAVPTCFTQRGCYCLTHCATVHTARNCHGCCLEPLPSMLPLPLPLRAQDSSQRGDHQGRTG